jgi:hypothetical protein
MASKTSLFTVGSGSTPRTLNSQSKSMVSTAVPKRADLDTEKEYFSVSKTATSDADPTSLGPVKGDEGLEKLSMVRASRSLGISRGLTHRQIARARLCGVFGGAISKAAITAGSQPLLASSLADYDAYADLFDEVLFLGADLHVMVNMSGTGPTTSVGYSVAYLPTSVAVPASYLELAAADYSIGPRYLPLAYGGQFNSTAANYPGGAYPVPVSRDGSWIIKVDKLFNMKEHGLNARPSMTMGTLTNFTPGMWNRSAQTDLAFGNLKWYFNNPASTNAGEVVIHAVVRLAFRTKNA